MFAIFGKKKIKEDLVANIFVNSLLDTIDNGFPEVAGIINDSPEFVACPNVDPTNSDSFTLIVIAANLSFIPSHLHNSKDERIINLILSKFSQVFDVDEDKFTRVIKNYTCYLNKVNHPSKNMHYAMSKGIFGKYKLNQFQDEYFKNMNSPNPMFLKRLDEAMDSFIWNWEAFKQKYQII